MIGRVFAPAPWYLLLAGFLLGASPATAALAAGAPPQTGESQARASVPPVYAGRRLSDVLLELQSRGLKIIFSSELVRPHMQVTSEPRGTSPRAVLDELLEPHGLEARSGAGGTLLVVRRPPRRDPPASQTRRASNTGTISGLVVDARTGAPLPGVVVVLQRGAREAVTDADGHFSLEGVSTGKHTLFVSLVGYSLARPTVTVAAGAVAEIVIPLADGTGAYTEQITVVADPVRGAASSVPSAVTLNSAEMLQLRGVLASDPFRAIQALPAAATGNDFRSEFSVRGSSLSHIGVTIDGIPTGWPVHTVRDRDTDGSVSLINGDVLDSVTLLAGAYPQDRPGRMGAWVDLVIRQGSRAATEVHGALSASAASIVTEGPIGVRGSWLVSVRQSYLQWLLKQLDDDNGTAFGFTDAQSKVVFDVSDRQQLQVTVVAGRSKLDDEETNPDQNAVGRGSGRAGLLVFGWRSTFGSSVAVTHRVAAAGNDFHNDGMLGAVLADGSSSELSYRGVAQWTPRPSFGVQVGAFTQRQQAQEAFVRFPEIVPFVEPITERIVASSTTSSVDTRITWTTPGGWLLDGGVMPAYASNIDRLVWSPWLLSRVPLRAGLTVRAGAAVHQQFPTLRQVAGTFARAPIQPERSAQVEIALEHQLPAGLRWQLTAYDRREHDVLRLEDSEPYLANGQITRPLSPYWANALTGRSYGVEVVLQRRAVGGLTGWLGYSYGRTRYTDELLAERFWADYDQRHAFNAYLHHWLSPETSVSGKLRLGSNFPIPGYFESRDGGLWVASGRNQVRLPAYARLDLRANHTFNFNRRRLTLFVEVMNVLNRENYAIDDPTVLPTGRVVSATQSLFPFLPSAGLVIDF
jgi:hypothetical protein